MEEKDALVSVFKRNAFYKRMHYLALSAFALSILVIGLLAWVLFYFISNPTPPLYFATDTAGRLLKSIPVSTPNMSQEDVVNWAIEAVESAYSYDYVNYRSQLQSSQKYFTGYGWSKYMAALKASNNLVALQKRKMVVIARAAYQPKLISEGILGGAYAWKYQMSMLMTYMLPPYDEASQFSNPLEVTIIVQRQPELQSYKGLGIVQAIGTIATRVPTQIKPISATPVVSGGSR